ncbi:tyrosine-type recombinase/integrase [Micromonospora sp. NPDC005806]|uniref:tyrosine-type recombinase/integrase n=1 Tax=Micromonospora sp. NPDC005806 TaxID=3364234 RepID=UPI0036B33880
MAEHDARPMSGRCVDQTCTVLRRERMKRSSVNQDRRRPVVTALIKLAASGDYQDRADAGRALASFAKAVRSPSHHRPAVDQPERLRPGRAFGPARPADLRARGAGIADLGEEHGHRVPRVRGKDGKVVLVPLPPAVARAIDRAVDDPTSGPILRTTLGVRMDRHAATRRLKHLAQATGIRMPRMPPHMLHHTVVTTMLDAGVSLRDVQIALPVNLDQARRVSHTRRVSRILAPRLITPTTRGPVGS